MFLREQPVDLFARIDPRTGAAPARFKKAQRDRGIHVHSVGWLNIILNYFNSH
jgi:hypothetical protein